MKGLFVTATDTDVGKTIITMAMTLYIKQQGINVGVMKPVQCGGDDTDILLKAISSPVEKSIVNPYYFENPISPNIAADIANTKINIQKIKNSFNTLSLKCDILLVEGAGGVLVPLNGNYLISNLIEDFNLPVIIVARPNLGTINHTLLTINQLQKQNIKIVGIIYNYSKDTKQGISEKNSPKIIETISKVPNLGSFPYLKDIFEMSDEAVCNIFEDYIDVKKILPCIFQE